MQPSSPEALLKSALEKIVYFEARNGQLSRSVTASEAEIRRLHGELEAASKQEIALRRRVAELEVMLGRANAAHEEHVAVVAAMKREQNQTLNSILDVARIQADEGNQQLDLARFIAQLRSEVIALAQAPSTPVEDIPEPRITAPFGPRVSAVATEMESRGRLAVSAADESELKNAESFATPSGASLFDISIAELKSPQRDVRVRAAQRLGELGQRAAAPALANSLNRESDLTAQVALLDALGAAGNAEVAPILLPFLRSSEPEVRIAALKAVIKLDPVAAAPHLALALKDPSSAVRRRASLLALGIERPTAVRLAESALADADPEVRSVATLVLGASDCDEARQLLQKAMADADQRVQAGAARALSSLLGKDLSGLVGLGEPQRIRLVRRAMRGDAVEFASPRAQVAAPVTPPAPVRMPRLAAVPPAGLADSPISRLRTPPPLPVPSAPQPNPRMDEISRAAAKRLILGELRSSLRGKTLNDLTDATGGDAPAASDACDCLVREGVAVRRGLKFFAA